MRDQVTKRVSERFYSSSSIEHSNVGVPTLRGLQKTKSPDNSFDIVMEENEKEETGQPHCATYMTHDPNSVLISLDWKELSSIRKVLRWQVSVRRVKSLPKIPPHENLLEELGIEDNVKDDTLSEYEVHFMKRKAVKEESKSPRVGTREYAAEDLRQLVSQSQEEFKVEEDMPPLLQICRPSPIVYFVHKLLIII
ncbi:hypothetical protein CHS0354_037462 [Potamilus streckersoni]|uniref:Uncharacterized protein n=1 Tax=Potamilus streckersoni TaxID=2493646 RepID=A0AAE0RPA1_9BIVA|nr:hypothetical protein CHS0354_037462 [Potamilus streckersoni]